MPPVVQPRFAMDAATTGTRTWNLLSAFPNGGVNQIILEAEREIMRVRANSKCAKEKILWFSALKCITQAHIRRPEVL
jgi:hypothetical protein